MSFRHPGHYFHYFEHEVATGWIEGGEITKGVAALDVDVAAGEGYVATVSAPTSLVEVVWTSATLTCTASSVNYIYVTSGGIVTASTVEPNYSDTICLGTVYCDATTAEVIEEHPASLLQPIKSRHLYTRDRIGSAVVSGLDVTENASAFKLDVATGVYYILDERRIYAGGTAISFKPIYSDGAGGWTIGTSTDTVDRTKYDDGTGTPGTTPSTQWTKHILWGVRSSGGAGDMEFYLQYDSTTHVYKANAIVENSTAPPKFLQLYGVRIVGIVTQESDASGIVEITDETPIIGQANAARGEQREVRSAWFPAQTGLSISGQHIVTSIASNGSGNFAFHAPADLGEVVTIKLIGIVSAGAAGAAKDIDLTSEYGAPGEVYNNHTGSDTASTYDLTGTSGQITEVLDLKGVFGSLAAFDQAGVNVNHNTIGGAIDYLGIELEYLTAS